LTLDEIAGSRSKINLIKAGTLYDEVGIYTTELKAKLKAYPLIIRAYVIVIHVLHPCKNIHPYENKNHHFEEDSDEVFRIPASQKYAGFPVV
jgi:hypothetical protein